MLWVFVCEWVWVCLYVRACDNFKQHLFAVLQVYRGRDQTVVWDGGLNWELAGGETVTYRALDTWRTM